MDFTSRPCADIAKELIGWSFYVREADGSLCGGTIIETEAYTASDAASHSFKGQTSRNRSMFLSGGHLYVYFTYGLHWCVNIVTGREGNGEAVLIRALRPNRNIERMRQRRAGQPDKHLCDGPAKICQALGITGHDDGERLGEHRFELMAPAGRPASVIATPRVGITRATDTKWRFILA